MQELAEIQDMFGKAGSYAALRFATDTADPERGGRDAVGSSLLGVGADALRDAQARDVERRPAGP